MHRYRVFGLAVASEFELPASADPDPSSAPDVVVRVGAAPRSLPDAADVLPRYQTAPGRLLLAIEGAGRFFVKDGAEIVVETEPGSSPNLLRPYLMGSAFAAVLQQRGILPLHASCIRVGEGAVSFAGLKGAGKSTLAAAFGQRGYGLLADDLCAVRIVGGAAVVSSGFQRLKLRGDAARALGLAARADESHSADEKQEFDVQLPTAESLVLHRLYVLGRPRPGRMSAITPVTGPVRLALLDKFTFRRRFLVGQGLRAEHLQRGAAAVATMQIYYLRRAERPEQPLVEEVEQHWAATAGRPTRLPASVIP